MIDTATRSTQDVRLPPQNIDAERCLLGAITFQPTILDELQPTFSDRWFYHDRKHRPLYRALLQMHESGEPIDGVTLAMRLDTSGELDTIGGPSYLAEIFEAVPHAAHWRTYAAKVRDCWIRRETIAQATTIIEGASDSTSDVHDVLTQAESYFADLRPVKGNHQADAAELMFETLNGIDARVKGEQKGLSTGFIDLDGQTSGLMPNELIILAARPSMGKTAFVANLAANVSKQHPVLMFSLEQSKTQLGERLIASEAQVNGHNIRQGDLTVADGKAIRSAAGAIKKFKLIIDDSPERTVSDIAAISRQHHRREPLAIVIIDYLQLIQPEDKRQHREQQVATISRRLKCLAKELNVPVVSLAQLNRGVEHRDNKRPKLADLRESGSIEQDADQVWFLHRPDAYDPEDRPREAELIVAKHRSGPTGIVRLTWRKEFMRFENRSMMADVEYFAG